MNISGKLSFAALTLLLIGCGGGGGSGDGASGGEKCFTADFTPNRVTPQVGDDGSCRSYVEGPPVGLACLHCLQPEARGQAELLAEIMSASCRRQLATFILIDGSFGYDESFLKSLVSRLISRGSSLDLYLYLTNGPWQKRASVPPKGFGTTIRPETFRTLIQGDEAFRESFRNHVRSYIPAFEFIVQSGVRLNLIPALEDNLDAPSARAIEALVREAVPNTIPYRLGRNPCPGCYDGNDISLGEGVFEDEHIHSTGDRVRVNNGLVSNDGETFRFPGETFEASLEYSDMGHFAAQAGARGNAFVLWRSEFQGRPIDGVFIDPAQRNYVVPNAPQQALLTEFLQTVYE